ncbi:MAG: OsmC family protein [Pseudomonadota bacterium]
MTNLVTSEPEDTGVESLMVNGINMEILQGTVQAIDEEPELGKCRFRASNRWMGGNHNCTTITGFYGAKQEIAHKQTFELHADEPPILAGGDDGANPVEHLLNALASCVTTSMVAHAAVRGIHIEELESELEGDIDLRGFLGLSNDVPKGYTEIRVKFKVKADVDNMERLKRLTAYSPVFNTITQGAKVDIQVEAK